ISIRTSDYPERAAVLSGHHASADSALSTAQPGATAAGRGAVLSMTLCVMVLIASEFMPVSLLTPVASDLGISEGQAGQAIAVSGVFAVLTSLSIARTTARFDRRAVLLSLTLVTILSGVFV